MSRELMGVLDRFDSWVNIHGEKILNYRIRCLFVASYERLGIA